MDIDGKVAVVTGGASGLGLAIATELGRAGAKVVVLDIERGVLDQAVGELRSSGVDAFGYTLDVRRRGDVQATAAMIADELGCSLSQLSIAWCAANPNVSTVITGASRVEQVHENLGALNVLDALDPEMLDRIDAVLRG